MVMNLMVREVLQSAKHRHFNLLTISRFLTSNVSIFDVHSPDIEVLFKVSCTLSPFSRYLRQFEAIFLEN